MKSSIPDPEKSPFTIEAADIMHKLPKLQSAIRSITNIHPSLDIVFSRKPLCGSASLDYFNYVNHFLLQTQCVHGILTVIRSVESMNDKT
ncbi:hypothetical protein D3C73_998920 [compost metagenome]